MHVLDVQTVSGVTKPRYVKEYSWTYLILQFILTNSYSTNLHYVYIYIYVCFQVFSAPESAHIYLG